MLGGEEYPASAIGINLPNANWIRAHHGSKSVTIGNITDAYNKAAGLERIKVISADGPSDYMRPVLNAMDEETFETFIRYHLSVCERPELVGAGSHTVDILKKSII